MTATAQEPKITYIVELPFKGHIQTRLINGFAEWSCDEVTKKYIDKDGSQVSEISFINQLTFDQYNEKNGGKFTELNEEQVDALFAEHRNSLISEFSEITEERYNDLLECLPPKRWHTHKGAQIFYMCEAHMDDLYTCCIGYNGNFFSALRPIREESESLLSEVKKAFQKL
ncbi:hypothetical protein [Flavobacterium sp. GNP002]